MLAGVLTHLQALFILFLYQHDSAVKKTVYSLLEVMGRCNSATTL